jgi:hypothetical protein
MAATPLAPIPGTIPFIQLTYPRINDFRRIAVFWPRRKLLLAKSLQQAPRKAKSIRDQELRGVLILDRASGTLGEPDCEGSPKPALLAPFTSDRGAIPETIEKPKRYSTVLRAVAAQEYRYLPIESAIS